MTEEEKYNTILDIMETSITIDRMVNKLFNIYKKFDYQEETCIKSLNKSVEGLVESIELAMKTLKSDDCSRGI